MSTRDRYHQTTKAQEAADARSDAARRMLQNYAAGSVIRRAFAARAMLSPAEFAGTFAADVVALAEREGLDERRARWI